MTRIGAALIGLALALSGCAVYAPYPGDPGYYAYEPAPVVVPPPVIGFWWDGGHRHHHHGHYRHWR